MVVSGIKRINLSTVPPQCLEGIGCLDFTKYKEFLDNKSEESHFWKKYYVTSISTLRRATIPLYSHALYTVVRSCVVSVTNAGVNE